MSKEQINLPKTAFSMKANLPVKEPDLIKYWTNIDLYVFQSIFLQTLDTLF